MSKTVTPFSGQLITFSTSVPFTEVTARLEAAVHKPAASAQWFPTMRAAKSKEDVAKGLHDIIGDDDFMCVIFQSSVIHPSHLPFLAISYNSPTIG